LIEYENIPAGHPDHPGLDTNYCEAVKSARSELNEDFNDLEAIIDSLTSNYKAIIGQIHTKMAALKITNDKIEKIDGNFFLPPIRLELFKSGKIDFSEHHKWSKECLNSIIRITSYQNPKTDFQTGLPSSLVLDFPIIANLRNHKAYLQEFKKYKGHIMTFDEGEIIEMRQ
jgi:hypothetical protein